MSAEEDFVLGNMDMDYQINGPTITISHGHTRSAGDDRYFRGPRAGPIQLHDFRERADRSMPLREQLERRIDRYQAQLDKLEEFGEDTYAEGTVLRFTKIYSGSTKEYTYAAIKAGDCWYTTGPKSENGYTWEQLCAFMMKGQCLNLRRASKWKAIGE